MINGKTFYQVLGVLNTAEDLVVRSAYRSLSNKYHPDKWTGDPKIAHERMAEFNAAYETLGDPAKRQKYDDELRRRGKYDDASDIEDDRDDFEGIYSEQNDAWEIALQFFPKLRILHAQLKIINSSLAYTFKTVLLERKNFDQARELAEALERAFLVKYFGEDESILNFARLLITNKFRAAARELNRVVRVMGTSVNSDSVKQVVLKNHPDVMAGLRKMELLGRARTLEITLTEANELLQSVGSSRAKLTPGQWNSTYSLTWRDGKRMEFPDSTSLFVFIRDEVLQLLR